MTGTRTGKPVQFETKTASFKGRRLLLQRIGVEADGCEIWQPAGWDLSAWYRREFPDGRRHEYHYDPANGRWALEGVMRLTFAPIYGNPGDGVAITKSGAVVARSKNLRGLRDFSRKHPVAMACMVEGPGGMGGLRVHWEDGCSAYVAFASFYLMLRWVAARRSWGGTRWVGREQAFDFRRTWHRYAQEVPA